jgi:competence protein ComEA
MGMNAPWKALETAEESPGDAPARRGRRFGLLLMLAVAAVLGVGSVAAIAFVEMRPAGQVELVSRVAGGSPSGAAASQAMVVVQVAGAVARPGVYTLPAGSRVADAIGAAGGYSTEVDPRGAETKLNLAAKLQDAQLIVVPRRGDPAAASGIATGAVASGAVATSAGGGPINLNTASAADLDTLPGIGPATAAKIISSREEKPFTSVDDLVARKIVAASTLAKFRDQVTV